MKITIPSCCEGDNLTSMSLFWVGEGPTFCQSDGYFSEMPRSELEMVWNEVGVGSWSPWAEEEAPGVAEAPGVGKCTGGVVG